MISWIRCWRSLELDRDHEFPRCKWNFQWRNGFWRLECQHFGSETESKQVKNSGWCSHMRTVTEEKARWEIQWVVKTRWDRERLIYFQQILKNSRETSEGRSDTVVKNQMQSDVTNANSNRIHDNSRKGWTVTHRPSPNIVHEMSSVRFVARIRLNVTGYVMRDECKQIDAEHGCESPCAAREHHEVRQVIGDEPCQSHRSTSMKSFRRSIASAQAWRRSQIDRAALMQEFRRLSARSCARKFSSWEWITTRNTVRLTLKSRRRTQDGRWNRCWSTTRQTKPFDRARDRVKVDQKDLDEHRNNQPSWCQFRTGGGFRTDDF